MINLLPQDNRKQLKASVMNVILMRYVFFFAGTLIVVAASVAFIYLALLQSKNNLNHQLEDTKQRALAVAATKTESENLRQDIKNVDTIFNNQVHYSNLFIALAKALPADVYIKNFAISHAEMSKTTPIVKTLLVVAKNNDRVIETKKALERAKFISSVSINVVNSNDKAFEVDATIDITFDKKGLTEELSWRK